MFSFRKRDKEKNAKKTEFITTSPAVARYAMRRPL
jgi:hypothetical protein